MNRRLFLLSGLAFMAAPALVLGQEAPEKTGSNLNIEEVQEFMRLHNNARLDVGVEPLEWSNVLAARAQSWANKLAAEDAFRHENSGFGENLAGGSNVTEAVNMWLNEKDDFLAGAGFMKTGHYTQVVWRESKQVGCGKAQGSQFDIYVAYYDPPGNVNNRKPY